MNSLLRTAQGILVSLGGLAVALFLLYGVANVLIQYSPAPVSGAFSTFFRRTDIAGWSNA